MALSTTQIIAIVAVGIVAVGAIAFVALNNGSNNGGGSDSPTVEGYSDSPILWVVGNTDGDQDIDSNDVAVIEKIIAAKGGVDKYKYADANGDGTIDSKDVDAVNAMIGGTATTLYYYNIDGNRCDYTVRDNVNIISVNQCNLQEVNMIINADSKNKVVGSDQQIQKYNNVFGLTFADKPADGVLVTGTSNGEVQAEIVSTLEEYYGHVEITLGSVNSYGKTLETDFADDDNVSIIRLPSWEDGTLSGVMTYGYLFGGVQKNSSWTQATNYYSWYNKYVDPIETYVAGLADSDKPNVITMYVKDCYPGATNKVLSTTSGDYERSELCGANNVGDYFGTGYVAVTNEDMAACQAEKGIDIIIVEPSGVYGDGGKEYVTNAPQLCINEFDGYISSNTDIYSLSFMVTTGPACVVSMVAFATMFFPDADEFADFDADAVFAEYLKMAGWDERTDISDIIMYGPANSPTIIPGDDVEEYVDSPILWVTGNTDGDQDIDEDDVAIIQDIITAQGAASTYKYADANGDGTIDSKDVDAVNAMIGGTATTLHYYNIDGNLCDYTVRDHVNILSVNQCNLQEVNMLINVDSESKVVGGDQQIQKYNNVFGLTFAENPADGVLVTGTSNGEVQAEIVSTLEDYYGHVEITLGSVNSYGKTLETDFADDENISIIRLPSWEDGTLSGVMTYGYLFGGVQKNDMWTQATNYYTWYNKYVDPIEDYVAGLADSDKPNIITMYVKDCYPGATNKVLSTGSGDYERSELCGGNNVGDYFGTGYVAVTNEDMAACEAAKGIDIIIVEPSGVYGNGGKEYVTNAVQLCINEFDGYINKETDIYSLSFMVTTGPACVVSMVAFAKMFFPDAEEFSSFDADAAFAEYLEMAGWDERTDISDIIMYGPGHTTS